jgi:hypothetical protein
MKNGTIDLFIASCRECGYNDLTIMCQISLFVQGVRDCRLCDNCIILLDGQISSDDQANAAEERSGFGWRKLI